VHQRVNLEFPPNAPSKGENSQQMNLFQHRLTFECLTLLGASTG